MTTILPATLNKSTFLPLLKPGAVLDGLQNNTVIDLGGKKYSVSGGWTLQNAHIQNGGLIIAGAVTFNSVDWTWPNYSVLTPSSVIPRMLTGSGVASDHLTLNGCDLHDANCTPLLIPAGTLEMHGCHVWNVWEHPNTDPQDVAHCDWIGALNGNASFIILNCFFEGANGAAPAGARLNLQAFSGDITVQFANTWVEGAEGAAFQFNARNGHTISGTRKLIRSWGHVGQNPMDRLDLTSTGGVVNVTDTAILLTAPPAGTVDPATAWRTPG